MLKAEVLDHFQRNASDVARALDISPAAVSKWGDIVPWFSAVDLEQLTSGALKVRHELYVRGKPLASVPADYAA